MFVINLAKKSNRLTEVLSLDLQKNDLTISLLLRLYQSLCIKETVIILDSGFCMLEGIIELMKKEMHAGTCIKKQRY